MKGAEGNTLTAYNPSNGEKLADFIDASNADVDSAVVAAEKHFLHDQPSVLSIIVNYFLILQIEWKKTLNF